MKKSSALSNAALALSGLETFARWWTKFEASHCKGIQATWTVSADLLLKLTFKRGLCKWQHTIDLPISDWENELLTLNVGLIKLQAVPQTTPSSQSDLKALPIQTGKTVTGSQATRYAQTAASWSGKPLGSTEPQNREAQQSASNGSVGIAGGSIRNSKPNDSES